MYTKQLEHLFLSGNITEEEYEESLRSYNEIVGEEYYSLHDAVDCDDPLHILMAFEQD